jgi:hypothetical protein
MEEKGQGHIFSIASGFQTCNGGKGVQSGDEDELKRGEGGASVPVWCLPRTSKKK